MDEKLQALIDMALAERYSLAFLAMKDESPATAEQISRLVELSEQILHHPDMSDEAKALVQDFMHTDSENNAQFQQYLYIQGAKDCVMILRELGVIK